MASASASVVSLFISSISPTIRCCEDTLGVPRVRIRDPSADKKLRIFPEKSSVVGTCPRPRRIILVRHGQSEGNVDESVYTMVPDPKIKLTQKGWKQAEDCGKRIRAMIESEGVEDWKDREKMRVEKEIRQRYGRFFYRFPDGESAADVYDRITGFRETLRADIDIGRFQPPGERSPNMNLVIVSHGLTLRVFLMRWYKWTVEQFENLDNFGNGGMLVMQTGYGGRYSLLVHHTVQELREFGLTEEMLTDQEWQKVARPGELNYEWMTSGPSFFTHLS